MNTCAHKVFSSQTSRLGRNGLSPNYSKSGGFTLIELLVVVAIIGIIAGLMLPAMSRTKSKAQAITCMSNSRQLAFAWGMYSMENNDRLTYNLGANAQLRMFAPTASPNWVNNIMDWELTPGNTNLNFVNQSLLAPNASYSANIFRCPADRALSAVQKKAGWTGRVRSVSMNAMVGDPGNQLLNGTNLDNPNFVQFVKEADFRNPASIFVFLDEHPDSINDGYFLNLPDHREWLDLPASYHNQGGSFSFADGHTEIHRWASGSTLRPSQPDAASLPIMISAGDTADFEWVLQHTSISSK